MAIETGLSNKTQNFKLSNEGLRQSEKGGLFLSWLLFCRLVSYISNTQLRKKSSTLGHRSSSKNLRVTTCRTKHLLVCLPEF